MMVMMMRVILLMTGAAEVYGPSFLGAGWQWKLSYGT